MMTLRSGTMIRAFLVCAIVAGSAGLGMNRAAALRDRAVQRYTPRADTPRLSFLGDSVPDAMLIRDFDGSDDDIYLLDAAAPRILVMHEYAGHWSISNSFGRRGGGPGELLQPSGIAVVRDSIAVADRDRIHFFSRAGHYSRTFAPTLPCPMSDLRVYAAGRGLLLGGRCIRGDTVTAELMYAASSGSVTEVAHDAVYTMGGTVGSPLAASGSYSPGPDHGLFGGGTGDCVYKVTATSDSTAPTAHRVCGLSTPKFAFVATAEFKAKARAIAAARPFAAAALAVPAFLPPYMGRLSTSSGDFVLRPVSNDSLAFRSSGSGADIMIAELDGLIGCKEAGCLWVRQGARALMMFIPAVVIEGALHSPARDARP